MSFKREGNDPNLLETLRRRRIKDLFAEEIPEDEAKLLCNGRLTCTVCPNNPIFDTATMLGVHRNGKKHLHNLQIFEEKKEELNHLIAVRKHQQYLKDGTTSIQMARNSRIGGFSTAAPYDSRVRKYRVRQGDRKPKLDLTESTPSVTDLVNTITYTPQPKKSKVLYTPKLDLTESCPPVSRTKCPVNKPRHSRDSAWKDICQQQLDGPVMHNKQLKNIFRSKISDPVKLKPYQSTKRSSTGNCQDLIHFPSMYKIESESLEMNQLSTINSTVSEPSSSNKPSIQVHSRLPSVQSCSTAQITDDKRHLSEMAQKYRLIQGSGWKRDWDGKWVKDEEAEFDSDEEPPDIP